MEDTEDRIWTLSNRDTDDVRVVGYVLVRERPQERGVRNVGSRTRSSNLFAQYVVEVGQEEADPAECREHYDEVVQRGNSLTSRVAQSGKFESRSCRP